MKKLVTLGFVVALCVVARAEAGVLNDPIKIKNVLNSLEPSNSWGWDVEDSKSINVTSVSLFTYENRSYGFGSIRVGYGDPQMAIGMIEFMVPNIVKRYIPEEIRGIKANLSLLTLLPSVGFMVGYDVAEKDIVYGPTAGAKITF